MRNSRRLALSALAAVAAAAAIAPSAFAASDYFLKIDGIPGETPATDMKGAIDVRSFSWDVENNATIGTATGGAGAGKAQFNELTIEKAVDTTTPTLLQRLGMGQPIASMELSARKAGAPYLRYCFTTVLVTDQKQEGSTGDDAPQETVTFRFGAVAQQYTRQTPTGAPATGPNATVFAGWSQILNKFATDLPSPTCTKAP